MSTSHRGLPPPSAMALPSTPNLSQVPDRWQHGTDETQRSWLQAKSDEERRRQEEERTKQESYRLEIRRTELEMLREAFRGGMPPHLVPVIFTGGGALAGTSAEWATHYISQLNQNQQQLMQGNVVSPPDARMESRMITAAEHHTPKSGALSTMSQTPGQTQTAAQHISAASTPNVSGLHQSASAYSPFSVPGMSPARNQSQQIHTTEPPRSSLPRINTNEIHIQPPPQRPSPGLGMQLSGVPSRNPPVQHLPPQSQSHPPPPPPPHAEPPRPSEASPLFIHHWQPPATQSTASGPPASTSPASGKNADSSPYSNQQYSSGSSNANKRRGVSTTHNRHRSDSGSARGYEPYPKNPASRQRRTDIGGGNHDSNGVTGQFSINHMTSHDESPELGHRETPKPQNNISRESPAPHQQFQAGPDNRHDHHHHINKERENSISHAPHRN